MTAANELVASASQTRTGPDQLSLADGLPSTKGWTLEDAQKLYDDSCEEERLMYLAEGLRVMRRRQKDLALAQKIEEVRQKLKKRRRQKDQTQAQQVDDVRQKLKERGWKEDLERVQKIDDMRQELKEMNEKLSAVKLKERETLREANKVRIQEMLAADEEYMETLRRVIIQEAELRTWAAELTERLEGLVRLVKEHSEKLARDISGSWQQADRSDERLMARS